MKKDSLKWFLIFVVTLTAIVMLEIFQHNWRMENSRTVTTACNVVEKYAQSSGPRNASLRYYLVLTFSDGQINHETTIMTTRQGYDDVTIGDFALCDVTYDEKSILDILVVDPSVEHYTSEEQGRDLVSALCVVGGIVVLFISLSVFLPNPAAKDKEGS